MRVLLNFFILSIFTNCLISSDIAAQALDINQNVTLHYLTKEINFLDVGCSPELINKTNNKYFDLSKCSSPLSIEINFRNSSSQAKTNYIYLGDVVMKKEGKFHKKHTAITLGPLTDTTINFTINKIEGLKFRPIILSSELYEIRQADDLENRNYFHLKRRINISNLIKGFFISFLIFTLFFLIQLRTKEFLYYFIYQLANIIYFSDLYWLYDIASIDWISKDSYRQLLKTSCQPVIYFFYFKFLRHFLETKTDFEKIDTWLRILEQSLILIIFISLGSFFVNSGFFFAFQEISRIYMSVIGIGILIYFFLKRNKLVSYLLWGGTFLLLGSLICLYLSSNPDLITWEGIYPLDFMVAGTIIEFFIFSFGLSYKIQLENKKYGLIQNRLNKQLLDNQMIREKKLNSLAERLTQAETERKIMAVELKSLRSQLNPHFLFNSLNSLKKYILKNEIGNATQYIDKFASLIRKMLSSSRKNLISLKDEIESLSLYLELENERLGFDLEWNIVVDESLDVEEVYIPPILIQPFVENAIWHGLINKTEGEKKLSVKFEDKKPMEITIKDNGVGIKTAKEIQTSLNKGNRKSLGTKMIQERIELIKRFYKVEASLRINENPEGGGTEIKIILPLLQD